MQCNMKVRSERADSYDGKKGRVNTIILALDDLDTSDQVMLNSVDYTLSDEEKVLHAGKLGGRVIVLGIRDLTLFGGRIRVRGKIMSVVK